MRASIALLIIGAVLTAVGLVPIYYVQEGVLLSVDSSYVLMMLVPAALAVVIAAYQVRRGVDRASALAALAIGAVIATIPFWGPSFDPGMRMPLDGVDTIVAHYAAGALVVIGALWQAFGVRPEGS